LSKDIKSKPAIIAILILLLAFMRPACLQAATSKATATVRVTIESSSRLTLGENPKKNSAQASASVKDGATPALLTVTAGNDPLDPVADATATASDRNGNQFPAVPSSRTETVSRAASIAQGCSASYSETFYWYLSKNWYCDTGKNSVTVIFTLTSP
jgi:hypothetical protein